MHRQSRASFNAMLNALSTLEDDIYRASEENVSSFVCNWLNLLKSSDDFLKLGQGELKVFYQILESVNKPQTIESFQDLRYICDRVLFCENTSANGRLIAHSLQAAIRYFLMKSRADVYAMCKHFPLQAADLKNCPYMILNFQSP